MEDKFLESLESPEVLAEMGERQLTELAASIRRRMIEVVACNGGHLAPSLGTVELTIALHAAFNTPCDKIIWDVGHQAYAHKILTKRAEEFATIRCFGGLSGFPKRDESPYDVFGVGHASTSISAALGVAIGRDLKAENYNVVAVIGDGAISSGMAFEAMNHAGMSGTKMIVVLNDNGMSIGANVGALSRYFNRIRMGQRYQRVKGDVEGLIKKVPGFGSSLLNVYTKAKDSVKQIVLPGMLFEDLGFTYYGPIDGHNINEMKASFEKAKRLNGPVLLHVFTQKGKGYAHAENQPARFHGVGPFEVNSGVKCGRESGTTYSQTFGQALADLAKTDKRIVAISAAMVDGTGLGSFFSTFPERSFDVGIAEQHAATFAAGLATEGFRPVVAVYSTFMQRCYDQILHDVCLQKLPVVFALDRAGVVGEDGPTHHGVFDLSFLTHIPNLQIMAPASLAEVSAMLTYSFEQDEPVAIRYPRGKGVDVIPGNQEIVRGKSSIVQHGQEVAVIALGSMVEESMAAAELLINEDIRFTLVNARFVKPFDYQMLDELLSTHNTIISVEENAIIGGMAGVIGQYLLQTGSHAQYCAMGIGDEFVKHGKRSELLAEVGLDAGTIAEAVRRYWVDQPEKSSKPEHKGVLKRWLAGGIFHG